MQNTVDERKQNGDDFFLSLAVTYFRSGNCPANGLVTEQPQYSVAICFFTTWQNTETMLISNGLRFIFICSLSLALPCIFHIIKSLIRYRTAILLYILMIFSNCMLTSNEMHKQWIIIQRISKYSI